MKLSPSQRKSIELLIEGWSLKYYREAFQYKLIDERQAMKPTQPVGKAHVESLVRKGAIEPVDDGSFIRFFPTNAAKEALRA